MNPTDQLKSVLCDPSGKCCITGSDEDRAIVDRALQALAQPAQGPVAIDWSAVHDKLIEVWNREISADEGFDEIQDLIDITPPQRKPLTDEAVLDIADYYLYNGGKSYGILKFARAIEAAHGIKENA